MSDCPHTAPCLVTLRPYSQPPLLPSSSCSLDLLLSVLCGSKSVDQAIPSCIELGPAVTCHILSNHRQATAPCHTLLQGQRQGHEQAPIPVPAGSSASFRILALHS